MSDIKSMANDYFAIDKEIKDSTKLLSQLRKKRKALEKEIHEWLRENDKVRIRTRAGELVREIQTRKVTVNAAFLEERAAAFLGDHEQAAAFTKMVYAERPSQEKEILKSKKPGKEVAGETVQI